MLRAIVMVIVVLALIAYGAAFVSWNQHVVEIYGLGPPFQAMVQDLPLGFALLAAVLAGALVLALFAVGSWAGQRSAQIEAERQLGSARKKLPELVGKIKEQRQRIAELEARLATAAAPAPAPAAETEPPPAEEDEEGI